ncbi:GspE/PulE family protein [Parageobacillus thermoglucosidasius]|uniref:GspE/PulE family protein n=1 Tax=Parageobacillus thermoglucosidasius TaxID=1426 RepID=UPI000B568C82|nr:ATPase, T2SS/T4P/T4SS family [Parageobacillus thermoglucosidasius]MBY6267344.1 type II secretion system protein GspE [Parageobacillus thermoglucosidasius]OUM89555.1 MAG: type II secretion system protein GspE [Parageobacillus thermoglucosidasius]
MKKKQGRKRLGDLLVEAGLITEEQLEEALREKAPGQKLGDVLLQLGYITEQQLIEVLEFQLGIPHVSLYRYPIDPKLTNLIPKEFAKRHMVMPLKVEGERLLVAMADPMDFFVIDDLRLSTGFHIETAIASKDDILRAINKYYDMDESVEDFLQMAPAAETTVEEERATEEDSPIVRLVNQILQLAVEQRASDVHIDPQETKVLVRYRIDGILRTDRALPKHMQSMLTARIKILANMDITEHRIPQDGRIKMNIDFHPVDLRVSTLPTIYGEKIVIRILDLGTALNDIHKLGFNQLNLRRFIELIERPNGIILITGPTGAGKSSTLYAALNHLNSEEVNIITIEDPVEYQIEGVNQIQVNPNIGLTFAQGLRSILRQDPNIIMVGEIRDRETAEVAIRASLTGHLVLSTLHTNDALSTITRLIDMGIEPFLVATSLAGVVSQRLVRRVCRDCQEEQEPTKREIEIFARRGMKIDKLIRGRGCPTCNMTGYKGRIAIHELLVMTDEMRRVILNKEPFSKLRELAIKNRMIFLIDDGLLKVKQGLTTLEEVLKVAILS